MALPTVPGRCSRTRSGVLRDGHWGKEERRKTLKTAQSPRYAPPDWTSVPPAWGGEYSGRLVLAHWSPLSMRNEILCVGELLWDALPAGLFLGGAPFNVAAHLHALGETVVFASRVGTDRLGKEARRRVRARGFSGTVVQVDASRPTGFVQVDLTETDDPDYEIVEPAAWDALSPTDALLQRAESATVLVFGSLAQRRSRSRSTIQQLAQGDVLAVFDVNLRPPYDDRAVVEASLRLADIVKLNADELARLQAWFGLAPSLEQAMSALAETFSCRAVCVTEGEGGAHLWRDDAHSHHSGYAIEVADTVGAGDAFLAAFLSGWLDDRDGDALLDDANRLGAYVASRAGAVPAYEVDSLGDIHRLPLNEPQDAA